MSEKETKVLIVRAIDHFRTDDITTENCILKYIGEYVSEDDNYLVLRYSDVYFGEKQDSEKLIKIIKSAIISKKIFFKETGGKVKVKDEKAI